MQREIFNTRKVNIVVAIVFLCGIFLAIFSQKVFSSTPADVFYNRVILSDTIPKDSVFTEHFPWAYIDKNWKYNTIDSFYELLDPDELITIKRERDISRKREALIAYIWPKTRQLPRSMPNDVQKGIQDDLFKDFQFVSSIDRLQIDMDYGINSVAYLFHPTELKKDTLMIYHQGHGGHFDSGRMTIEAFLEKGYPILAFDMPLRGHNSVPVVQFERFGPIKLENHDHLMYLDEPFKYFFEPITRSLNYIEKEYAFKRIAMTGISGGGWTATVYPAIDDRIERSYPVAGTYPIALRMNVPGEGGDFEQNDPGFYRIATYYELYVMAGYGEGRQHIQIINRYDNDWVSGIRYQVYEEKIRPIVDDFGKGGFLVFSDTTHRSHSISQAALSVMLFDLQRAEEGNAITREEIRGIDDAAILEKPSSYSDGDFFDVVFSSKEIGYIVGGKGMIVKTTDGGFSWGALSSGVSMDLYGVHFVNDHIGWVVGEKGTILHTIDGGKTWIIQRSGRKEHLADISCVDATHCWAVGGAGRILTTGDGGTHWTMQESNVGGEYAGIDCVGSSLCWAVATSGVVSTTVSGGTNWGLTIVDGEEIRRPNMTDVDFVDGNTGWAVGEGGLILRTSDGGVSWRKQPNMDRKHIFRIFTLSENIGWVVGAGGVIQKTDDAGETWVKQGYGIVLSDLFGVAFIDGKIGFAVGKRGTIVKTTDGGVQWKLIARASW